MDRVKIALLDSGIDKNNSCFMRYLYKGERCFLKKGSYCDDGQFDDDNGHGSLCTSVILKECKRVEFYIIKIMDDKGLIDLKVLECTLEKLLHEDVNIVSMSLSIVEGTQSRRLEKLCMQLCKKGIAVVCSITNGRNRSFPANFKDVFAVRGFILSDENEVWERRKGQEFIVDNNPHLHQTVGGKYVLFGKSNSYACAKMSGVIAKTMIEENICDSKIIRKILVKKANKHRWINYLDLKKSKRFPVFKNKTDEMDQDMLEFLSNEFKKPKAVFYIHSMFDSSIGLKYEQCGELLKKLESFFKIEVENYELISRYDFYSIYSIINLMKRYQRYDS